LQKRVLRSTIRLGILFKKSTLYCTNKDVTKQSQAIPNCLRGVISEDPKECRYFDGDF
jgi:hypothetical protein